MSRYDVCMVVYNHFVGDSRVEKQAAFLAEQGLRVKVLALAREDLPRQEVVRGFEVLRLTQERFRVTRNTSGANAGTVRSRPSLKDYISYVLNIIYYQCRATWELVRSRPQVIHSHDLSGLQPGFVASRLLRCGLIYDSHELWLRRNIVAQRRFAKIHRIKEEMLEARMIGAANRVITVSGSIADTLQEWYGIERPTVLVNGSEETRPVDRREIRDQITGDGPICVYIGGRVPGRGLKNQIRALTYLPDVRLVMIGSGATYFDKELMTLAQQEKVEDRVFILPSVPAAHLLDWISSADIGLTTIEPVCLSYRYSLPNKIFQYAMAGIPVLASDLPDMALLVKEYGLGSVCDPEDPASIAREITAILSGEVSTMPEEKREVFRSVFSWSAQQEILKDVYADLGVL